MVLQPTWLSGKLKNMSRGIDSGPALASRTVGREKFVLRITAWAPAILATAALGVFAPTALGAAALGSNGCKGNSVATENHDSAFESPSGNPNASTGPGVVLGGLFPGSVRSAIEEVRSSC
jgi:hypothetical protein